MGNLTDMKRGDLLGTAEALFAGYGDFVRIKLFGPVGLPQLQCRWSGELLARPADFQKRTIGDRSPLSHLREYSIADALFTAEDDEESWHIAHRILCRRWAPARWKQYFPKMLEVTDQLLAQLSALGRGEAFWRRISRPA